MMQWLTSSHQSRQSTKPRKERLLCNSPMHFHRNFAECPGGLQSLRRRRERRLAESTGFSKGPCRLSSLQVEFSRTTDDPSSILRDTKRQQPLARKIFVVLQNRGQMPDTKLWAPARLDK